MRGFSRAGGLLVIAIALSLLASCKPIRDCHGFLDQPPTFLLVDRVGDEGVPYYDTTNVHLSSAQLEALPSCDGFDGLVPDARISLSDIASGDGLRCDRQTADAVLGATLIPYNLPDDTTTLLLAADLTISHQAVLLGSGSVSVGGCEGEWVAMVNDSYSGDPTDDPGEGATPPWTIARLFRPGAGGECAALTECVDVFTARVVLGP